MPIPPRRRPSHTTIVARLVAAMAAALLGLIGPMTAGARAADAPPPPPPKGMALLVAVGEYRHARMNEPKLEFPEADAKAMATLFTAAGYSVKTLLGKEATQGAIRRELEAIASGGDGKGVAVVGLFGHGVQVGADAHYCGYDAGVRHVTDSDGTVIREKDGKAMLEPDPATLVSMREILDALARTGAGGKLLLADCCRKDPAGARGRAFGSTVAVADLPGNTVALFACEKDEQAFEHRDWGHGAFTKAFLDACEANPAMSAVEIYGQVRRSVRGLVAAKVPRASQTPHGLINGDIDLGLAAAFGNKPRPDPPPAPEAGEPITNSLGMRLVAIPAGESGAGFLVGRTEVTQEEWAAVMDGATPSHFAPTGAGGGKVGADDTARLPVESVTWEEADDFCRRLTDREREAGALPEGRVYRLPTAAEWRAVAEIGPKTPAAAWHAEAAGYRTRPVATRAAGDPPVHDLLGNVEEWCLDADKDDASGRPLRKACGGSWLSPARACTPAASSWHFEDERLNTCGLRVVLAAPTP